MRTWIALLSLLLVTSNRIAICQSRCAPLLESLAPRIEEAMKRDQVPGTAVAIVDGDTVIWSKGFGVADVTTRQPVTDTTVFSVQSISKMYTTLGFLKSGIKLDDKLVKVYPAFSMRSRDGSDQPRKITFRHLLSHWGGLPHEAPLGGNYDERYVLLEDHIASLDGSWMKAPVGSRYSYSNVGVDLAGYALQLGSKKPFADYMKSEVLASLGMTNSTFSFNEATENSNFARGHIEGRPVPITRIPMQPSGGMYSTAADMATFLLSALRPGATRETLSRMAEMCHTQLFVRDRDSLGGFGVFPAESVFAIRRKARPAGRLALFEERVNGSRTPVERSSVQMSSVRRRRDRRGHRCVQLAATMLR